MSEQPMKVRFAPSPTGYLHVGGARTALFNWLLARQSGGTFVLRIEDTDRARHVAGAETKILDDLRWLGLDWDEGPEAGGDKGPYYQSQRLETYQKFTQKLLEEGKAFYAWDTPEELEAMRAEARKEKRSTAYRRPDPLPTIEEGLKAKEEGKPVVVRFLMPDEDVIVHDRIRGDVRTPKEELEDFVIQKSDGWPTYHFAVVVDDADMGITLVCRGQDHLSNTTKHVALQAALGFDAPDYAHLPLIFNMSGGKMGKRDKHTAVHEAVMTKIRNGAWTVDDIAPASGVDEEIAKRWYGDKKAKVKPEFSAMEVPSLLKLAAALGVQLPEIDVFDFRQSGYLPEALGNFLNLLGWSTGEDIELFTREEATKSFDITRVNKSNAKFDRDKLMAINTQWVAKVGEARLLEAFRDFLTINELPMASLDDEKLKKVLQACEGFRTFRDVEMKAGVLFAEDSSIVFDAKAVKKVLTKNEGAGFTMIEALIEALGAVEDWSEPTLEKFMADFCEQKEAKLGDVAQPIRVAVTGRTVSPGIGITLEFLGKDRTLARLQNCLAQR